MTGTLETLRAQGFGAEPIQIRAFKRGDLKRLVGLGVLGFCGAYAASYLMRPAYRAEVLIIPASHTAQESLLSNVSNAIGGLGMLAGGIGGLNDPNRVEFVETLRSSGMARKFIEEQGLVNTLCATKIASCGPSTDGVKESQENAVLRAFERHILSVSEDKRTGVVHVTITWIDRKQAATWANEYVALANRELQGRAIAEARQRVTFLQRAAAATDLQELRAAIFRLMESEVKMEMLASTQPDYAFRVIDLATPPDEKDKVRPLRSVFGLLGTLGAIMLGYAAMIVVGRYRQVRHDRWQAPP